MLIVFNQGWRLGLETGFLGVLRTGTRNIGRNPVSRSFANRNEKYRKKPGF